MWPSASLRFSLLSLLAFFVGRGLLDAPLLPFSQGDFAAISALRAAAVRRLRSETRLRAASFFLDAQKEAKEAPRGRLRMGTVCPYSPSPLDPRLRGSFFLVRWYPSGAWKSVWCPAIPPGPTGALEG